MNRVTADSRRPTPIVLALREIIAAQKDLLAAYRIGSLRHGDRALTRLEEAQDVLAALEAKDTLAALEAKDMSTTLTRDDLLAHCRQLLEWLRDYGRHNEGCSGVYPEYRCRCGWRDDLVKIAAVEAALAADC